MKKALLIVIAAVLVIGTITMDARLTEANRKLERIATELEYLSDR